MSEPTTVYAGDTIEWTKALGDYPATECTLSYSLVREGASISITASASGSEYAISVPAATSAAWQPGEYQWTSYVTSGATRKVIETGSLIIRANPAAGGYDTRSYVKRVLDAIEAMLEGRATSDVTSYSIGGRSVSKASVAELLAWRSQYRREYEREQAAARLERGLGSGRKILTRM